MASVNAFFSDVWCVEDGGGTFSPLHPLPLVWKSPPILWIVPKNEKIRLKDPYFKWYDE